MRKFAIFCLLIFNYCSSFSQSLYELKYTDGETTYLGFLVYYNENNSYMRIGYTTAEGYNVVNITYKGSRGKLKDGKSFFCLTGSNPQFILNNSKRSYNPDYFVWLDGQGLPLTTDDLVNKTFKAVTSYKQLKTPELTTTYLHQFYRTDEQDYISLTRMNVDDNKNTDRTTVSSSAKMHLIIAANTKVADIGVSCRLDEDRIETEFTNLAQALGIEMKPYIVDGENFNKTYLLSTIENLRPGANDIVCFVYRGHGFRWSNQDQAYPQLDLRYSNFVPISNQSSVNLADVYNLIKAKGARLNIVLGDCCNSDIGRSQVGADMLYLQANTTPSVAKLKSLFMENKADIIAAACKKGEVSWTSNTTGGFFTMSFLQAMNEEISYLRNGSTGWKNVMDNAVNNALNKSKMCSNCTEQNGIYWIAPK